jgi:enoyl-CoA hydratase/carnithine racemase
MAAVWRSGSAVCNGVTMTAEKKLVETYAVGNLLVCRLNRPQKKNALTHVMYTAMGDALQQLESDNNVRVLIFTGSGDSFTAGNDLADFVAGNEAAGESPVGRFLRLISTATKPVIAAVNGLAVGVGVTMLLHCDFAYASPDARFKMPFVDLGLVPEAASSMLVPQLVGLRRANELFMLSEMFSAAEAAQMGFVNSVVDGDVLEHAIAVAERVASKAPSAIRRSKELMRLPAMPIPERMTIEGRVFAEQLRTPEFKEAATAFAERRPADFSSFD